MAKWKIKRANDIENQTIENAFEEFLEEKSAVNKSAATLKSYQGSFDVFMKYINDTNFSLLVKDLTADYFYAFSQHNLNEEMKPTSINHYLREMRAFAYWCIEKKKCQPFKIKLVQEQEYVKETYTDDELMLLLERPKNNAMFPVWRTWAIINWILATGNRAGTVCGVLVGDIDFKKREIYINKTKNNRAMILPMSTALYNCLSDYVRKFRNDASVNDYLFPNVGDELLTTDALKKALRTYNKSKGVDRTSVHALRHTFAKLYIRNTGNVFKLQKILGHKTLEMTRRYVSMFDEDLKDDYDTYSPLDTLKKKNSRTVKVKRNDQQ